MKLIRTETVLKEYEKNSEIILTRMLQVLTRAQRKEEDTAYRKVLQKIENHK